MAIIRKKNVVQAPNKRHVPGKRRSLLPLILAAVGSIAAVIIAAVVISGMAAKSPDAIQASAGNNALDEAISQNDGDALADETPALTPTPAPTEDASIAVRPTAMPGGYLPIFSYANTQEKVIAITVDDCNQTENLDKIINCAVANGGKLTIFPIGKNLKREGLQEVIRKAYALGMELENHSYSHSAFYRLTDEEMAKEIYYQNMAVSATLGVNYQMHFMRTRGGDNRKDLRTHQYIEKMGYYGMAHWTMSGSSTSLSKLITTIEPGNIYLFHTTDNDLEKLLEFIPAAVEQGYRLVTLNEMFGLAKNEVTEITTPLEEQKMPKPDAYVYEYKTLKSGDYLWDVYLLQERLIELGWLEGKPDGVYGKSTYTAIGYFQKAVGIKPTGEADPKTQEELFAHTAPRSKDGKTILDGTPSPTQTKPGIIGPDEPIPTTTMRAIQKG